MLRQSRALCFKAGDGVKDLVSMVSPDQQGFLQGLQKSHGCASVSPVFAQVIDQPGVALDPSFAFQDMAVG